MKKVNIFYISDFGGHSIAAKNLKEAFYHRDSQVRVLSLNGFGHFYPRSEKVVDFIYTIIIKHFPFIWGTTYDRKGVIKHLTPIQRWINKLSFRKLSRLVRDFNPDCLVATQAFPCGMLADFKKKLGLKTPLVAVVTDYHPHRFWIHPFVDKYVVACSQAKEALIQEGVDADKVKILGIPISVRFLTSFPKDEVAREIGFRNDLPSVLLMGGALGMGAIKEVAQQLDELNLDFQMIVVCGRNERLHDWFDENIDKFKKPIHYFGYIDFVNKIMDFSDIIVTKGGGITISEALAKGMAIIIDNPIPGQEERNVNYLFKKNAIIEADNSKGVVGAVEALLQDKKKIYALKEKAKENSMIDSSLRIVDLILGEIG
ncbi:MAG: glycosyltransferase [Candidatus Omnitrophica bacterium]|nr:glycosyltransferase [Candidatus Omnitrophota bacterium]